MDELSSGNVKFVNVSNLYNNVKPGDITHEDVQRSYNEYFAKFGRRMKLYVCSPNSHLQQLPCFIFQAAYDLCMERVTGPITDEFNDKVKEYTIPQQLVKSISDDGDICKMFQLHSITLNERSNKNQHWEILKAAYGCLLYISQAKSYQQLSSLTEKILSYLDVNGKYSMDSLQQMTEKAVELAWNMVTLVPPALVVQPAEYLEEWHDKRITSWDDDASPNPSVYFRPVLFHSCLGHVGCKGVIGNITPENLELVDSHYTSKMISYNTRNGDSLHNEDVKDNEDVQDNVDIRDNEYSDQSLIDTSSIVQQNEEENNSSLHTTCDDDKFGGRNMTINIERKLNQLINEKFEETVTTEKSSDQLFYNKQIDDNVLVDRNITTSNFEKYITINSRFSGHLWDQDNWLDYQ
jgi:hypothetical protein